MLNRKILSKEQALFAVENGELSTDTITSKNKVVIVLTQDWCPQWVSMSSWIYDLQTQEDIDVYELIYNKVDFFNKFLDFKENVWKNYQIPYLRYYKDGKLFKESNYLGKQAFMNILEI